MGKHVFDAFPSNPAAPESTDLDGRTVVNNDATQERRSADRAGTYEQATK